MRWFGLLVLAVLLALPFATNPAGANDIFQQQTGLPCGNCHLPNQELKGRDGLNPFGLAFLACGHKLNCAPNPISARTGHTTENFIGVATLSDTCTNGEQMFVVIRVGKNKANRDIAIVLDPGNHAQIGFDRGSTYAYRCGSSPDDRSRFFWIPLNRWTD